MAEAGGPSTQAGIFYQNSIAALALADLLNLDSLVARERLVEVRLEAPTSVDDIVLKFGDGHREFLNVKLSVKLGTTSWKGIWQSVAAQQDNTGFSISDQLSLVIAEQNSISEELRGICERASGSVDEAELRTRLNKTQIKIFDSIAKIQACRVVAFETLRRMQILHRPVDDIEKELSTRRVAGGQSPPPSLLNLLRDIAGGAARRRGIFQPGPLRRLLKTEHGILLGEPTEWGLNAYRETIREISQIEIPGLNIAGAPDELFVWPRVRRYDRQKQADFEDDNPRLVDEDQLSTIDLRAFPNGELHRVVVVAGPGFGKSALLTALASDLVKGPIVPLLIPLSSLASADKSVMSFIRETISAEMDLSADWQLLAEQGLVAILYDGLDEVPSGERKTLMKRIATFSARYPRAPWMLTVRDAGVVTGLAEAMLVEILPLNDHDIERFASAMKSQLGTMKSWQFARHLHLYPDLNRLARIPLFLVMLLATVDLSTTTSLRRSDLIETYLKTLFSPVHHKTVRDDVDRSEVLKRIAEILAYERLEEQELGATEDEVRDIVKRMAASPEEVEPLYDQLIHNGILRRQSAIRLQFPFPIVQEYLAARYLVENLPHTLETRIDDAVQRPWAQVIQFALELHPAPESIIKAMLERQDDAFRTGLRLVGRCIANGAKVGDSLKNEVGNRLVAFWVQAPSRARERTGRLLADGFVTPPSESLRDALHHRWLIENGAGDIVSMLGDEALTLRVLGHLLENDRDSFMIWHSLKPALRSSGNAAFHLIIDRMDPDKLSKTKINKLSSSFSNFTSEFVSRELAMAVAHDKRLPVRTRMRGYELAGTPLDENGLATVLSVLRGKSDDSRYEATRLIGIHPHPAKFAAELLRDRTISVKKRREIATRITDIIPDPEERNLFYRENIGDPILDQSISIALRLFAARYGDRAVFEYLIDQIEALPIEDAATTIALFGHFRDQGLAEKAAIKMRKRATTPKEIVRVASSVNTGMRYIFEMDFGFGGTLQYASPHPGIAAWQQLLEDWATRIDFSPLERINILFAAAESGSETAAADLEQTIMAIPDFDAAPWHDEDVLGHNFSHAVRYIQKRHQKLPLQFIERIIASERYNVAVQGITALEAHGDEAALRYLIDIHPTRKDWHLKDTVANTIELLASRLQLTVTMNDGKYDLQTGQSSNLHD